MNSSDVVVLSFLIVVTDLLGAPVPAYGSSGCTTSECHQEIPDQSIPVSVLAHVAAVAGMRPETTSKHSDLLHKLLLLAAWVQLGGPVSGGLILVFLVSFWLVFRRKIKSWLRNKLNEEEINN